MAQPPARVASAPKKPLLIFDGDCGFCRHWILRWKYLTADRVDYAPSQEVAARFPEIDPAEFQRSVQLITQDGRVFSGAQAVFRSLAETPGRRWLLPAYRRVPGFAAVTELAYGLVARHRRAASKLTGILWGKNAEPSTYGLANALFLRLVGISFLAAFLSLGVQVDGLIGSHGILPVGNLLDAVRSQLGGARWDLFPTLCWLDGSDRFLHLLCGGGALAALLVTIGILPVPALIGCWVFYLSLCVAGQDFLEFQWDLLLLEAGFLSIFLAPPRRWRLRTALTGSVAARLLLLWLLFRLMFSSGFVKLSSGDPNWRNLTALTYHYWTQPLPPWTAWFMSHGSLGFQKFSCLFMFLAELGAPLLIVAPRRLRVAACCTMIALQLLIAATGNYAFFNLLAIALCVLLLDDQVFPRKLRELATAERRAPSGRWPRVVIVPVAAFVLLLSLIHFTGTLGLRIPWPGLAMSGARAALPFRSVGGYGLFMVMTTTRPEIILEGSDDGALWKTYEFRWKPGAVAHRPRFVAPHQPRLDWQMWFAALGSYKEQPWFLPFCARLLENEPAVTALLAKNPFPQSPPRYLRAVVYEYRFTTAGQRRSTGAWWAREEKGLYVPVLSREMLFKSR